MASFSVLIAFWIIKTSQVKERSKEEKQTEWRKQRTAVSVFLRTFGALPEVHFLHAIYHFKDLEVKNPKLQTVYDLELKWGRYDLRKTTAPGLCEIRTTPSACAKFAQHLLLVRNSHQPMCLWCEISSVLPTPHEIFSFIFFDVNSFLIPIISQSQALIL